MPVLRSHLPLATTLLAALSLLGCQSNSHTSTRSSPTTTYAQANVPTDVMVIPPPAETAAPKSGPNDPATSTQRLLGMEVYTISVPVGSVGSNEAFWKRVNEDDVVTPAQHNLLDLNGIRIGTAALDDWPYFKSIMDDHPASTIHNSYMSVGVKPFEIEVKHDIPTENIFYFDQTGRLVGRTHENCQNIWTLSFLPIPRDPDSTRIMLSPLIRSMRRRWEAVLRRAHDSDPPEREIEYVAPEYLFDLAIDAVVPPNKFLVIAPSSKATGATVGDAFLIGQSSGQRVEHVLLFVPHFVTATIRAAPLRPGS